jgi:tRNA threonylcarbamoyladenosine biosynthesis protein TsaB
MIICLETSTSVCSVALCNDKGVISLRESEKDKSHASLLTVYIEEILKETGLKAKDLDAIAVSKGPGSFTGLRIGVSVAKGMAYSASKPLIGIDTTFSMFNGLIDMPHIKTIAEKNTLFCPMIDARRSEVYYSLFDQEGNMIRKVSASVINEDSFMEFPEKKKIIFFGDGSEKCKDLIKRKNSYFADGYKISAAHMLRPAYESYIKNNFEDLAYFEPFYLKDFLITKPVKNILGT